MKVLQMPAFAIGALVYLVAKSPKSLLWIFPAALLATILYLGARDLLVMVFQHIHIT